jgi:hypothetical protein
LEALVTSWRWEGVTYHGVKLAVGVVYCVALRKEGTLTAIIEDIKAIFGVTRRGVHRVTLGRTEYTLYYVPVDLQGRVVWETPLTQLDKNHPLRSDPQFRRDMRRLLLFCDLLSLGNTTEGTVRVRCGTAGSFVPVNYNENTTLMREQAYDYSVLGKKLLDQWFGEETSVAEATWEMMERPRTPSRQRAGIPPPARSPSVITADLRSRLEAVIKSYNPDYIWLSYFIIDRMSRNLLSRSPPPPGVVRS